MRRHGRGSLSPTSLLIGPVLATALLYSDAQGQEAGCKNGFCWEVYSPKGGETLIKIIKWPKSTHRNIRWGCEAGGCQVEGVPPAPLVLLPANGAAQTSSAIKQALEADAVCFDTREHWLPGPRTPDHKHGHLTPHLVVEPTSRVIPHYGRQVFDNGLNRRGHSRWDA